MKKCILRPDEDGVECGYQYMPDCGYTQCSYYYEGSRLGDLIGKVIWGITWGLIFLIYLVGIIVLIMLGFEPKNSMR